MDTDGIPNRPLFIFLPKGHYWIDPYGTVIFAREGSSHFVDIPFAVSPGNFYTSGGQSQMRTMARMWNRGSLDRNPLDCCRMLQIHIILYSLRYVYTIIYIHRHMYICLDHLVIICNYVYIIYNDMYIDMLCKDICVISCQCIRS